MHNQLKKRLSDDQPIFGAFVTQPSVGVAQLLASSDLDWLMIDLEHGMIDLPAMHAMVAATGGTSCTPLVRTPLNDHGLVEHALDAGANGLVFPTISTLADAEATVAAIRYPPDGHRGWGPFYAAAKWGLSPPDYYAAAQEQILNVVLIEQVAALGELDDILAVPGIDVAAIAPGDLSVSVGFPGQREHPEVLKVIAEIERKVLASNVALGGVAFSPSEANEKVNMGYRMLFLGADVTFLQRAVVSALDGVHRKVN